MPNTWRLKHERHGHGRLGYARCPKCPELWKCSLESHEPSVRRPRRPERQDATAAKICARLIGNVKLVSADLYGAPLVVWWLPRRRSPRPDFFTPFPHSRTRLCGPLVGECASQTRPRRCSRLGGTRWTRSLVERGKGRSLPHPDTRGVRSPLRFDSVNPVRRWVGRW